MGVLRTGTSLRSRFAASERPNRLTACTHCGLVSFIWPSSAPTTITGDMPLIPAGDTLTAPAMIALDIKNLFGESFTLHGPSPSQERHPAARLPPDRARSGRLPWRLSVGGGQGFACRD